MCPGRWFAQTEMQSFIALFVTGFEIESADGGLYVPPKFKEEKMFIAQGVRKPERDVQVKVRRREGYEEVEWGFEM